MATRSLTNFETFLGTLNRRRKAAGGEAIDAGSLPVEDAARWVADILHDRALPLQELAGIARQSLGLGIDAETLKEVLDVLVEKGLLASDGADNPVYRLTDYARKALGYFRIA